LNGAWQSMQVFVVMGVRHHVGGMPGMSVNSQCAVPFCPGSRSARIGNNRLAWYNVLGATPISAAWWMHVAIGTAARASSSGQQFISGGQFASPPRRRLYRGGQLARLLGHDCYRASFNASRRTASPKTFQSSRARRGFPHQQPARPIQQLLDIRPIAQLEAGEQQVRIPAPLPLPVGAHLGNKAYKVRAEAEKELAWSAQQQRLVSPKSVSLMGQQIEL
jgi:hypothetical protein